MNYAYLDRHNILHVVEDEEIAKEYTKNGLYMATDLKSLNGYPYEGGSDIVVYGIDEAYIEGNVTDGKRINLKEYKATYNLYQSLLSAK